MAAKSAPFNSKAVLKVSALGGLIGSICGFHTSNTPITAATATKTSMATLRVLIGQTLSPQLFPIFKHPWPALSSCFASEGRLIREWQIYVAIAHAVHSGLGPLIV